MNLYGFASGDPVNFGDPFGLCAASAANGAEGGGASGAIAQQSDSSQGGSTECKQLAERAGEIASSSESVGEFARRIGPELAGVSSFRTLRRGGTSVIPRTTGGYRDQFGGDASGQAAHFAASVWAMNRYGRFLADYMFSVNETYRIGRSAEDYNLTIAAFDMLSSLRRGALTLAGVRAWILSSLCNPGAAK
jgi:hypothetical protein